MNDPRRISGSTLIPILASVLLGAAALQSLPRFSAEQAIPCKNCHINPTGGGARNEFGNFAVAFQELCLPQTKPLVEEYYRKPRIGDLLLVGFDSRHLLLDEPRLFRMQSDFYATLEPFKNFSYHLRFSESGIDENYALIAFGDQQHSVKFGRMYPAFGLRQDDHTSLTRTAPGLTPRLFLDGISFQTDIEGFNLTLETFHQAGQGIYGMHLIKPFSVGPFGAFAGGSARFSERNEGTTGPFPHARAVFGGVNYSRITLTGEATLIGLSSDTLASYAAASVTVQPGLYLVTEYNFLDPDRSLKTGTSAFVRASLEIYPVPFVKLRPSYTRYLEGPLENENDFFIQFHVGY